MNMHETPACYVLSESNLLSLFVCKIGTFSSAYTFIIYSNPHEFIVIYFVYKFSVLSLLCYHLVNRFMHFDLRIHCTSLTARSSYCTLDCYCMSLGNGYPQRMEATFLIC